MKRRGCLFSGLLLISTFLFMSLASPWSLRAEEDAFLLRDLDKAKAMLQSGVDTWSAELLKESRELFLNLFLRTEGRNPALPYFIALADIRMAIHFISLPDTAGAEKAVTEAEKYLDMSLQMDPSFGESHALYAYLLGFELALHPERAMTLAMKSMELFNKAFQASPDNPRVHLLKGQSVFYTPEAYGGGAENALKFLEASVRLFEKEDIRDPWKPSWGKEEAYAYLGLAYKKKGDLSRAADMLKKALEINPKYGLAGRELQLLEQK